MVEREAALALHHFGLGARPGELGRLTDPRQTLAREVGMPRAFTLPGSGLSTRPEIAGALLGGQEMAEDLPDPRDLLQAELDARLTRALTTEHGFAERLVWFWANHFTVAGSGKQAAWTGLFEREVVRANLTGRFEDLLLASCTHPGMLLYLDQAASIGPNSKAGLRRERGLNENLAREILELHTLGVGGGYTQADVTELARALTGWTVVSARTERFAEGGAQGDFVFVSAMHEPGAREVVGVRAAEDGVAQAELVLRSLARHPSTARHVATKLARHFVDDFPSEAVISALERVFLASDGDLPTLHRALLDLPEAWEARKRRTPQDFVVAALRLLDVDGAPSKAHRALHDLGQATFRAPSPAGWPDTAAEWAGPDALMRRVTWTRAIGAVAEVPDRPDARLADCLGPLLTEPTARAVSRAATATQGLMLGLMSPEFQRR